MSHWWRVLCVVASACAACAACAASAATAAASSLPEFTTKGIGSMTARRVGAVAVPMPDGRVLIAGGSNGTGALSSAEVFDPQTGRFNAVASMHKGRAFAAAALLPTGMPLIIGGCGAFSGAALPANCTQPVLSAEAFDPARLQFVPVPDALPETVVGAAAAALFDGRIIIAGGTWGTFDSVMLFTPSAAGSADYPFGTFTLWDQLDVGRLGAAAAPLPSGRVLLVGGCDIVADGIDGPVGTCAHAPDSAETLGLSGPFIKPTAAPPALKPYGPVAVPMADGLTMVTAGGDIIMEFYSPPPANSFSVVQGSTTGPSEWWAAAAPLLDGDAVIAGGSSAGGGAASQALLFMPAAEAAIPHGLRFSNVQVGSKAVAALVVTNVGGQPLVISGVSLAGRGAPDYTIKNGCAGLSITFGQSCTLTVRFKPKAPGRHWATFTLRSNSITSRIYRLFGDAVSTGTAPSAALPTGGPGAVPLVTCRRVTGVRRCTRTLIAATATFTIARAKVIVSRSGVTYARGVAWLTNLYLSAPRTIPAGSYTMKFITQDGSKTVSRAVPFRVG